MAVLVASLLLSGLAIAPERHALASAPDGTGGTIRYVGPGTGTAPCDTASIDFTTGVVGDGSDAAAIQAAVDASLTGDTVFLCNDVYDLTTGITLATSAASSLTFRGETTAGTNVSGGDAVRLFAGNSDQYTFGKSITFIGMTLSHGWTDDGGGAVKAGNVVAIGVEFRANVASLGAGGAIWAQTAVEVIDGTFTGNSTSSYGDGGAIYVDGGTVSIVGVRFAGNSTNGSSGGGAIYAGGDVSVTDATFTANASANVNGFGGGAIYASGHVRVSGGSFSDNTTAGVYNGGGAIHADGTVMVSGGTFTNNRTTAPNHSGGGGAIYSADAVTVAGATFANNATRGRDGGGAIFASGPVALTSATFTDNSTGEDWAYGGAIRAGDDVTVSGGTFADNATAGVYAVGGAIYADNNATVVGATFANNSTAGSNALGGAIYGYRRVSVSDATFTNNSTAGSDTGGGAIWANRSVAVTDGTFTNNSTAGSAGGGAISVAFPGTVSIDRATFSGNSASDAGGSGGGAIHVEGSAVVVNATFVDNSAGSGGGAIQAYAVEVTNGTFVDDSAATGGHVATGTLRAANTIFAGGTCDGSPIASIGLNLTTDATCPGEVTSGTALGLLPLADYGGTTQTVALGKGSVARDATAGIGGALPCFTATDQRGRPRPYNTRCDIGAFEGPVPGPAVTLEFAGPYWVKPSGSLTPVPLTAYVTPAVAACTITFSVSDGTRTFGPYAVTTDLPWDSTTATLPKGTYSVALAGSGDCDGATATGRLTIASGQSTAGTTGSGDYTVGSTVVTFDHSLSTSTTPAKNGSGAATSFSASLTWAVSPTWRLAGSVTSGLPGGRSLWIRIACPEDIGGLRPAACGRFALRTYVEEWTTGTKGRKLQWVRGDWTEVLVTVYDGGTTCSVVGRKQVCTALPDWFGLEYLGGYRPAFATELMAGTMTRIRSGAITAD